MTRTNKQTFLLASLVDSGVRYWLYLSYIRLFFFFMWSIKVDFPCQFCAWNGHTRLGQKRNCEDQIMSRGWKWFRWGQMDKLTRLICQIYILVYLWLRDSSFSFGGFKKWELASFAWLDHGEGFSVYTSMEKLDIMW